MKVTGNLFRDMCPCAYWPQYVITPVRSTIPILVRSNAAQPNNLAWTPLNNTNSASCKVHYMEVLAILTNQIFIIEFKAIH
jgi:hypothetical protein